MLSCVRCQQFPTPGTRLFERTKDALYHTNITVPATLKSINPTHHIPAYSILAQVEEYLASPILAGLISSLLREWPYVDYSDSQQVLEDTYRKEVAASSGQVVNTRLNYSAWFARNCDVFRLAYNIPCTPVQLEIRSGFDVSKVRIDGFPSCA